MLEKKITAEEFFENRGNRVKDYIDSAEYKNKKKYMSIDGESQEQKKAEIDALEEGREVLMTIHDFFKIIGGDIEGYDNSDSYYTKKAVYMLTYGDISHYMIDIYTDSECTKTKWVEATYCGYGFGWSTIDDSYIGDEHPNSKYSTPLKILSMKEYAKRLS